VDLFFDGVQQLFGTGKVAKEERWAVAHDSAPAFTLRLCVGQPCRDDCYLGMAIAFGQFRHLQKAWAEREKCVKVGLGCWMRVDIGIPFGENDQDFACAEQAGRGQHHLAQVLPGLGGSVGPLNILEMLSKLLAAQDDGPVRKSAAKLDQETQFMMFEPGERTTTVEEQRKQIARLLLQENSATFVVEHNGQLVGYLSAFGGEFRRNKHSAYIVIGMLQAFTGKGIGGQLFAAVEAWAHSKSISRLELTVMVHNSAGLALYRKRGFTIEGTKKHSLLINGRYVDEYYMTKLLD